MMRLALYLLLVLSTGPALALDGAIAGRIEDGTTGTGLMGAYVLSRRYAPRGRGR